MLDIAAPGIFPLASTTSGASIRNLAGARRVELGAPSLAITANLPPDAARRERVFTQPPYVQIHRGSGPAASHVAGRVPGRLRQP